MVGVCGVVGVATERRELSPSENWMPLLEREWRRLILEDSSFFVVRGKVCLLQPLSMTAELGNFSMVMMLGGWAHASPSTCIGTGDSTSILNFKE